MVGARSAKNFLSKLGLHYPTFLLHFAAAFSVA
jgi:hypothetical protein